MPVDSRRLQGPENGFSYRFIRQDEVLGSSETTMTVDDDVLDSNGLRGDSRTPSDGRKLFAKNGVVGQAKGSAYIEQGKTKVVCAVYGPREVQKKSEFSLNGQVYCEFKFAPFSCHKKRGHQQDNEELEISRILREALEAAVCLHHFPKSQVEVFIMVLENDGSPIAASLTCAGLALADASVAMYDLVIGGSLRQYNDIFLLDPTADEEWQPTVCNQKNNSNLTIGYMPSLQQLCAFAHEGMSDVEPLHEATKLLVEYCGKVQTVVQNCLKESVEIHMAEKAGDDAAN